MATIKTHFKLGLFTLVALAACLFAAFALGARSMRDERMRCHMYFDESVQGLEVGSPVKYRGVSIGSVERIGIAPDKRHVHVTAAVDVGSLRHAGLISPQEGASAFFPVSPDLRAQLGTQGITGVKYVNLDYFDSALYPPPELSFQVRENTIASAPSSMKTLEDGLVGAVASLPAVTTTAEAALHQVELLVQSLNDQDLPLRIARVIDNAGGAVTDLRIIVADVDKAKLPSRVAAAIDSLGKALLKVNGLLKRLDGDDGFVASATRATDAFSEVGTDASAAMPQLEQALRDVAEAAQAIRDLAQTLERDPDMLLKGRSEEGSP